MKSSPGGKGSGRRNAQVPMEVVDDSWDLIFKQKTKEEDIRTSEPQNPDQGKESS